MLCWVRAALLPTLGPARGILTHSGICWVWGRPRFLSWGQVSDVPLAPCGSRAPPHTRSVPARGTRGDGCPGHPLPRRARGGAAPVFPPRMGEHSEKPVCNKTESSCSVCFSGEWESNTRLIFFFLLLFIVQPKVGGERILFYFQVTLCT